MSNQSTADQEAREALEATPDADLLRYYAQATHVMHELRGDRHAAAAHGVKSPEWREAQDAYLDARARRDLIEAEVLSRMGGTR